MSHNHVVIWLDHQQAHIIHFNAEVAESESIKLHSTHPLHEHGKDARQSASYYDKIAHAISEAREILVTGPGMEKLVFMKYLMKHHHDIGEKVMSVETLDHPSDGQLLKFARKYFAKADLFV